MDITQTHSTSDKENQAPSPSKVSYPELPRVSPVKRHQHAKLHKPAKRHQAAPPNSPVWNDSGLLRPSPLFSPNTPSNIGRNRAPGNLAARLYQTPPRPSNSDKVRDIFSQVASRSPSGSGDSTSSALTSESEIEKRLNKLGPYSNKVAPKASSMNAAAAVWNHPLPLRFVIPNQPSTHEISEVSSLKSPAGEADSSSDEWTGDEEFLPKNVRHQARMLEAQKAREREEQKRKKKEAPEPKPFMSPENLCKAAENSREVKKLLEASPLKKAFGLEFQPKAPGSPSRFTPMWIEPVRDARLPPRSPKKKKKPRPRKSSDADDEEDSDPDL